MRILYKILILIVLSISFLSASVVSAQDSPTPNKKPRNNDIMSRIDFGGYLGLQFGTVTILDIAPMASYRVTEKFHAGLGFTYMYYKDTRYTPDYSASSYGFNIFTRYFIWRDLFAHVEYAPLNVGYYDYDASGRWVKSSVWVHDILLGGGYRQRISDRASVNLMVLWNVNESFYSPYSNPIIRIGFGIGL